MTKAETISYLKAYLNGDTAVGNIIPLRSVLESAIEALSQPSLPSDLDEAAEEIATDILGKDYLSELDEDCAIDALNEAIKLVKAGAEWMAGQGVAYEDIVERDDENDFLFMDSIGAMISLEDTFKSGDEVVVQIRKK